jgi:RNA polymerase sigma-70 factor (ECF subfamily)
MLAVARRFVRNDETARDLVQEAFISAFRAVRNFRGNSSLSTWLHRIVVNAALMHLRHARRHPELLSADLLPQFDETGHHTTVFAPMDTTAEALLLQKETRALVRAAIDRLPVVHRTVLLMRDIEELSTSETAQMLGISDNAVKIRLHRARQALTTLLARQQA